MPQMMRYGTVGFAQMPTGQKCFWCDQSCIVPERVWFRTVVKNERSMCLMLHVRCAGEMYRQAPDPPLPLPIAGPIPYDPNEPIPGIQPVMSLSKLSQMNDSWKAVTQDEIKSLLGIGVEDLDSDVMSYTEATRIRDLIRDVTKVTDEEDDHDRGRDNT